MKHSDIPDQMIESGIIWGKPYIIAYLGLKSWQCVERLISEGLPCNKVGGRWCIRPSMVDGWFHDLLNPAQRTGEAE